MENKKLFLVKCAEGDLGRYNATHIYSLYIIASSVHEVIRSVLKPHTKSVEIVSVFDYVEI